MDSPVVPSGGVLTPLGISSVRLHDGFWGSLPTETIIDHCHEWIGRVGWIANFTGAPRRGREFSDSEVYKLMEAMAWTGDPRLDELTWMLAVAQEPDGYLNTKWGAARYSDLEWGHELYCYGHLIQAGVAQARAAGGGELLEVAKRAADHVCEVFMNGRGVCGPRRDRDGADRALPGDPGRALPGDGPPVHRPPGHPRPWPTSSSAGPTSRTTCRSGRPTSSAATPSGRST